jgi:hypothetical protein
MSNFELEKQKKTSNWAADEGSSDGEDSEDLEEEVEEEKIQEEEEEIAIEEESESEVEIEEIKLNIKISKTPVVEKKKDLSKLSKKERKELKQKELNDLDALIASTRIQIHNAAKEEIVLKSDQSIDNSKVLADSNIESEEVKSTKKKNKKKKNVKSEAAISTDINTSTEKLLVSSNEFIIESSTSTLNTTTVDVNSILKLKAKKTASSKKTGASDAQKIALSEALKAKESEDKKKKKDKKKFNETSY